MRLSKNSGKIFWGLLFILAAAYLVACKFWSLPSISIFTILLTVFLVTIIIKGIKHVNFWEILFPIAFLCILYDEPLGITTLTPWTVLGAALLGSIGLYKMIKPKKEMHFEFEYDSDKPGVSSSEQCTGENIKFENHFGESIKYINSDNFCNGHFENNFGSLSVYFAHAIIQNGTATAYVENHFGEIQLYIPKEWKVVNNLEHTFGSIDESGRQEGSSASTLILKGETSFGAIEIHYI